MASDLEQDDMGSLFEGMVLFNPSQIVSEIDENPPKQSAEIVVEAASDEPEKISVDVTVSQPLDENLFSDLTLITPSQVQITPESSPLLNSAVSRQTSIRKKKRAGLRIGYGRDVPVIPDDVSDLKESMDREQIGSEVDTHHLTGTSTAVQERDSDMLDHSVLEDDFADITTSSEGGDLQAVEEEEVYDKQALVKNNSSSLIELRFEEIKTKISEKLKHAREAVVSVSAARKDSIRRRRKAADNLNQAYAKYNELEKQLEEACEAEDFDKAERVSERLSSAEREKESMAFTLRDAEADCDNLESRMQEVLDLQIQAEEECASLLESFTMDSANDADLVIGNAETVSMKEMEEWQSSSEELEAKKMELEIEFHLVNDARSGLNNSIESLVEDDRRERDCLHDKKKILMDDLEKLLALVREKEAEIAENDSNIKRVENRIADVVSGFQELQSIVDTKCHDLQSGLSQIELDNESLSKKRKEIDEFFAQEEARGSELREMSRIAAVEANSYQEVVKLRKQLMQFVLKAREDKLRLNETETKLSQDVQMLKQAISTARASVQELSSTKARIHQEIESYNQRLLFIDKRVPELEAEKKVAATARNFREAARIASEAKVLGVEKEELQTKMETAISEIKRLEEEAGSTLQILQETEMQISSKEKELETSRYQRLILIARAASAERSAAIEVGDLEEADILLAEVEAAVAEAKNLQMDKFKEEDFLHLQENSISMELISKLDSKQLMELASSVHIMEHADMKGINV
ncbi:Hypothetical predicted protein [Olea europaea subsp. europaea]|uniref:UVR domain-containing protein n=1 Tax=Olea europaea subsp. europaea TaxID=158383 RepID=A0A8S0Q7D8_OLEEU|nr:Hypothetical predicted protein [Olea europaea subsp. europaea]